MNFQEFCSVKCSTDSIEILHDNLVKWMLEVPSKRVITFLNPHVYNYCVQDSNVKEVINKSDIVCIDGIGVKLGFLLTRCAIFKRTIMTYLFDKIITEPRLHNINAILIGTSEREVSRAAQRINEISHSVRVVNWYHGYNAPDYYISEISKAEMVRLVLIGMSSPISEELIYKLMQLENKLILWHIGGGTIKCYANTKRRSPRWLSRMGLEWFHRMIFEPHLIHRYILGLPKFVWNISIGHRKYAHG